MSICPDLPEDFTCEICRRFRPKPKWGYSPQSDKPPICWSCEQEFGTGAYADLNPDRRINKQISALAEALKIEAHRNQLGMEALYGRA